MFIFDKRVFGMRFFIIKPVLGSIVYLFLLFLILQGVLRGVLRAEIPYMIDSVYRTNPEIVSETLPIRVGETAIPYDFPHEPQIIERRILSTRIISPSETVLPAAAVSPPANSKIKTIDDQPLLPFNQTEYQTEYQTKHPIENQNQIEHQAEHQTQYPTEHQTEYQTEQPFRAITFPLSDEPKPNPEPDRITNLKPTQPLPNQPYPHKEQKPKQTPPVPPVAPVVLGQSSDFAGEVDRAFNEPLPSPKGLADASAIDPKLYENPADNNAGLETPEPLDPSTLTAENNSTVIPKEPTQESKLNNGKQANGVNGVLLLVTIVSVSMLIYAVVIAFDYHQRWIQSLTTQNNRFSALPDMPDTGFSGDDTDMDADFSGNIPLYNNSNSGLPAGLSRFRSESPY
jgi:hypothetical protein